MPPRFKLAAAALLCLPVPCSQSHARPVGLLQVFAGTLQGALPVAIKVMRMASDTRLRRRFWREVAILQRCLHANIVQIIGVYSGVDDSICGRGAAAAAETDWSPTPGDRRLMVVMEWIEGGTLREHISQPDMRWWQR